MLLFPAGYQPPAPFLFEGQLSSATAAQPRPPWLLAQTAHFSLISHLQQDSPLDEVLTSEDSVNPESETVRRIDVDQIQAELTEMEAEIGRQVLTLERTHAQNEGDAAMLAEADANQADGVLSRTSTEGEDA